MSTDSETPIAEAHNALPDNRTIMEALVTHLLKDIRDDTKRTPALLECARKLLLDNSITISSVRRGDFGALAKAAAETFPFNDDGSPRADGMVQH